MSRIEAMQQYRTALKSGLRCFNTLSAQHKSPYPVVLDDIMSETQISGQQALGIVEIPLSLVTGTLTAGRKTAFAANYMPILPDNSEFAGKWISLCQAQLDEGGIRDAIKCMEFMGRFYVIEGHKRVSVLRSFGAMSIMADVTRMVPVWSDAPDIRAYYEFMHFNKQTGLYHIQFTAPGKYDRLLQKIGFDWDHKWTHDEVSLLLSMYFRFQRAVDERMLHRLPGWQACDVMLECMEIYTQEELLKADDAKIQKMVAAILPDLEMAKETPEPHISTAPEVQDKGLVRQLLDDLSRPAPLVIAFVYAAAPEQSEWAAAHDEGRKRLEEAFENQIQVKTYVASRETADTVMEEAVTDGAQVFFVTAPLLMASARRIAALHPSIKVLVCALSVPYTGIRTYYGRVYEAKFVLGAVAGALCHGEPIGCIARYPILGVPAAINAFALGARLTCPDAKIILDWSCLPGDPCQRLLDAGVRLVTCEPGTLAASGDSSGLFLRGEDGQWLSLAWEVWNWGRMYQKIVRSILDGGWGQEDAAPSVNYWWGMNGGVINVRLTDIVPEGTAQLAKILRSGLVGGGIQPFLCTMKDQQGKLRLDGERWLTPVEIMQMNWLSDIVSGHLPNADEILEMSRETTKLLALPEPESTDQEG